VTVARRLHRVRRLLADLRRRETRGSAILRIRRRAASAVVRRAHSAPPAPPTLDSESARSARERLEARFAEAAATGQDLASALVATIRAMAATDDWLDWNAAWSLAQGVARWPEGAVAADLAEGLLLHRRGQLERAWTRFERVDDAVLAIHAPVEAVDGALAAGDPAALARARTIGRPRPGLPASAAVDLAGRLAFVGETDAAAALLASLDAGAALDPRHTGARHLLEAALGSSPAIDSADDVSIGVMRFRSPDAARPPGDLGDEIQSLAALGHLARLSDVPFTGDDGLGDLVTSLQARVPSRLRLRGHGSGRRVRLVPIDREASSFDRPPQRTWLLAFGPHLPRLFGLRHDFPYHPDIRPIFVSLHVTDADLLDERSLAYLRAHGPIGCRDWSTVFLLLSAGVDAFFSGCLSTTVDGLFPERAPGRRPTPTGFIDTEEAAASDAGSARLFSHEIETSGGGLIEGLQAADRELGRYRAELGRAVTTRLTAFLALGALGVPAELRTREPGDPQRAGLADLVAGDPRLTAMQDGLRDLLAATFAEIVDGIDEATVHDHWRERTAARVAEARARWDAPIEEPETTANIPELVASVAAASRRFGPSAAGVVADVAISFDQNLRLPAGVLVESLVATASGPVRLWILARGLASAYEEWLGGAFPDVPITFLPCDAIGYGPDGRPRRVPRRITVSTMDRLFLPDLLPDVRRVVYVDVDTLFADDVATLARADLGPHGLAATESNVSESSEWDRAGRRLPADLALELRRTMARRHGFGHRALNAGVLVLDLDRLRRDEFTRTALARIERYGLHDQDVLLAYAGPDRAVLDPRWNAMPRLLDVEDPRLIHWASFPKPWDPPITTAQDRWREHAARLLARVGPPPD